MSQPHGMGRHVMLDGWTLNSDGTINEHGARLLDDAVYLERLLNELVDLVGMKTLKPAEMIEVPLDPNLAGTDEDCGGATGVVILTTSHSSVHTWPLRGHVSFDLYSCRDFDAQQVLAFLRERLHLSGGRFISVPRGFHSELSNRFDTSGLYSQGERATSQDHNPGCSSAGGGADSTNSAPVTGCRQVSSAECRW